MAEIAKAIESSIKSRLGGESIPIGVNEDTGDPVYSEYQLVLDDMDDATFAAWYGQHREAIQSCQITETELSTD